MDSNQKNREMAPRCFVCEESCQHLNAQERRLREKALWEAVGESCRYLSQKARKKDK